MHETAALQRADAMIVVGVVDGLDPQDVAHEVGVRAPCPHLQPGGRSRLAAAGRVRQNGPPEVAGRQVAVEAGEPSRHAGSAQLDAPEQLRAPSHTRNPGKLAPSARGAGAGVVPVEHAPGVVLLGVGREPGAAQPGDERRNLLGFARLLGQPAARRPVRGPAEVAAGVQQQRPPRGGHDCQQRPVVVSGTVGSGGQVAACHQPLPVRQQGVVVAAGGEGSLGHAAHDGQVEFHPERQVDRPDQHARAEVPVPVRGALQLEPQRPSEGGHRGFVVGAVEISETADGAVHPLRHLPLLLRPAPAQSPAEVLLDQLLAPAGQLGPGARRRAGVQVGVELLDEAQQLQRALGAAPMPVAAPCLLLVGGMMISLGGAILGVPGEPAPPAVDPGLHPGGSGLPLPRGARHPLPSVASRRTVATGVGVGSSDAHRGAGQPSHHDAPGEPAVSQGQHVQQRPPQQRRFHRSGGGAATRDAGRVERIADQAHVGALDAVDDGASPQGGAGPGRVDHSPHGVAHFVVGVRDAEGLHRGPSLGAPASPCWGVELGAEPANRGDYCSVGVLGACRARDDRRVCRLADRSQQACLAVGDPLRQEHDHRPELARRGGGIGPHRRDRSPRELLLVAEACFEVGRDLSVDPHHVGSPRRLRRECPELPVP